MTPESRRETTEREQEVVNEFLNETYPEVVPGEIWSLEIGRFKVVTAGKKFIKLRRL